MGVIEGAASRIVCREVTFEETAGAGSYAGSVDLPAGAWLLNVAVQALALWDAATSATLNVGDAADDDGFFTGVNMKATDLLAGETIDFAAQGGKAGAYLTATHVIGRYSATARIITGTVTTVGGGGTAGRTRLLVVYVDPGEAAATKS